MKSYGKINLLLDVVAKRRDGYHDIQTVFQSVSLADEMKIFRWEKNKRKPNSLKVNCTQRGEPMNLPTDADNLAGKMVETYYKHLGKEHDNLNITIEKHIPQGAGMGGGSANAATVANSLQSYHNHPFTPEELNKITCELGADIPFLLQGGTMFGEGVGERLSPLPPMPPCYLLLCQPDFHISTAEMYSALSSRCFCCRPSAIDMIEALEQGDLEKIAHSVGNVFEAVLPYKEQQIIENIKNRMLAGGALAASMTGSGSVVFGIFTDLAQVEQSRDGLLRWYPWSKICTPVADIHS